VILVMKFRLFRLATIILLLLIVACNKKSPMPNQSDEINETSSTIGTDANALSDLPITTRGFQMGTAGFVPRHYPHATDQDWRDFFAKSAASYGGVFGVHVKPGDKVNQDGIPEQVQLAFEQVKGVEPYIALSISYEDGPFTIERGEELKRVAVAIAGKYQPQYLSLGLESNLLYLFQPNTFELYIQSVREAYDEIKAVSPHTQVMNNFQLEHLKGQTLLTGQEIAAHWQIIELFEGKMDLISFTVYPFLAYEEVDEIPSDYLAEIREHTSLSIIITETGWPSQDTVSSAKGSPQAQVDYLTKLIQQADAIEVEMIIWVFPHDAVFGIAEGIFDHLSLLDNDGNPKPGFEYWQAINSLPMK